MIMMDMMSDLSHVSQAGSFKVPSLSMNMAAVVCIPLLPWPSSICSHLALIRMDWNYTGDWLKQSHVLPGIARLHACWSPRIRSCFGGASNAARSWNCFAVLIRGTQYLRQSPVPKDTDALYCRLSFWLSKLHDLCLCLKNYGPGSVRSQDKFSHFTNCCKRSIFMNSLKDITPSAIL